MGARKNRLHELDTYVFIDVSNIRWACLKTLGRWLDFVELINYFKRKYLNLKEVRYYEGIAQGDTKKQRTFNFLARKGYTICPLERKSYYSVETKEHDVECPNCHYKWVAEFVDKNKVMKSNVDVYLATELLTVAHTATQPVHIVLVSCDGDYAEMIKNALNNPNVIISVLATPRVHNFTKNTLSTRLQQIFADYPTSVRRYYLQSIGDLTCFSKVKAQK